MSSVALDVARRPSRWPYRVLDGRHVLLWVSLAVLDRPERVPDRPYRGRREAVPFDGVGRDFAGCPRPVPPEGDVGRNRVDASRMVTRDGTFRATWNPP